MTTTHQEASAHTVLIPSSDAYAGSAMSDVHENVLEQYQALSLVDRMALLKSAKDDYATLRTRNERWQGSNHLMELDLAGNSPVGSFKYRGAWNAISSIDPRSLLMHGVVTASAGNHALGVALAVRELNDIFEQQGLVTQYENRVRAMIVVPRSAAPTKIESIQKVGGSDVQLIIAGGSYNEAFLAAQEHAKELPESSFIHPYDDEKTVEGQSTAGYDLVHEILARNLNPVDTTVVVPVGGGGLLAGVTLAILEAFPDPNNRPTIIGAQLEGADSAAQSWSNYTKTGVLEALELPTAANCLADGTSVDKIGRFGLAALPYVSDFVTISNQQLAKGYTDHLDSIDMNLMVVYGRHGVDPFFGLHEPASMIAEVAADKYALQHSGRNIINLKTGINYNPNLIEKILRFA